MHTLVIDNNVIRNSVSYHLLLLLVMGLSEYCQIVGD
jgi:hypothetical protein